MNNNQNDLLETIPVDITIKEEVDPDPDYVVHIIEGSKSKNSTEETGRSKRSSSRRKLAFVDDMKKRLAKIMKEYPLLWDKNHGHYRNRSKREESWWQIGDALDISVFEAKALWKKLKDTHRYLNSKTNNKTLFNPGDFLDDEYNEMDDSIYDSNVRNTRSVSGDSTFQANTSLTDRLNADDSNCDENSESFYEHTSAKRSKSTKTAVETITAVSQITSSSSETKKEDTNESSSTLKHMHIWVQLEKLFEKIDDDKITDLNFLFVSETYKAILDKRKNQK